jgi:hypothetical protein
MMGYYTFQIRMNSKLNFLGQYVCILLLGLLMPSATIYFLVVSESKLNIYTNVEI